MLLSSLAALLTLLGSIVNCAASSSTPSPVPVAALTSAVESSPTDDDSSVVLASSGRTVYNDGGTHIIGGDDELSSSSSSSVVVIEEEEERYDSIIVTDKTTLIMQGAGSVVTAPDESNGWPAMRLSNGGVFKGTDGTITGSFGENGGHAVEMYNGQSTPETASFGYYFEGMTIVGGGATYGGGGVGGNALYVHGYGTEAFIYGGTYRGGKGPNDDDDGGSIGGLSVSASNGATVHVHSGTFGGDMEVGDGGTIAFYGCFLKNETSTSMIVRGAFVDETTVVEVGIRTTDGGGTVSLVSVSEQECDTAPSSSPTNFPTGSYRPTVVTPPKNNGGGGGKGEFPFGFLFIMAAFNFIHFVAGEAAS